MIFVMWRLFLRASLAETRSNIHLKYKFCSFLSFVCTFFFLYFNFLRWVLGAAVDAICCCCWLCLPLRIDYAPLSNDCYLAFISTVNASHSKADKRVKAGTKKICTIVGLMCSLDSKRASTVHCLSPLRRTDDGDNDDDKDDDNDDDDDGSNDADTSIVLHTMESIQFLRAGFVWPNPGYFKATNWLIF